MSKETVEEGTREHTRETDVALGDVVSRGLGFGRESPRYAASISTESFFWGGYGGSVGMMDLNREISLGYVPNRFLPNMDQDPRNERLAKALRQLLLEMSDG